MTRAVPEWLLFASDAALLSLWGAALLALAGLAWAMDRRRHRRDRVGAPDRVGWVPWTGLFLACAVSGAGLLAVALPRVMAG